MKIIDYPSPNFNGRRDGVEADYIVLHYTGMPTAQDALSRLCDPAAQVSAHYVVDEGGSIYRLVDEEARAWHAGQSFWRGITDMNSRSIGIEIVNPGHEFGYRSFPGAQMEALAELCQDITGRRHIPAAHILAHADVAPARKQDPGELFDWAFLAARGIGLWPQPQEQDYAAADRDEGSFDADLLRYGYDPQCPPLARMLAFQRHFYPEAFGISGAAGKANRETRARLKALLRMVESDEV